MNSDSIYAALYTYTHKYITVHIHVHIHVHRLTFIRPSSSTSSPQGNLYFEGWVCHTFFCPYPFKLSCRFEQGTWNGRVVQSSSEQIRRTILCSSQARRQLRGCLCLWYGNRNSQAVKSITNKIEKFQGTEFVQTEQQKTSTYLFVEHPYERCGILKISWYSVMSRTIHPTPYFCTQEGKS